MKSGLGYWSIRSLHSIVHMQVGFERTGRSKGVQCLQCIEPSFGLGQHVDGGVNPGQALLQLRAPRPNQAPEASDKLEERLGGDGRGPKLFAQRPARSFKIEAGT